MKVYELIAELVKLPAGDDVLACRGQDTHLFEITSVDGSAAAGMVRLVGDDSVPQEDDIEC